MATEIEHKYLVDLELWSEIVPDRSVQMSQAYMKTDGHKTIRVRTTNSTAFLTIKGKTTGFSRSEFEYEIPLKDGRELMEEFCDQIVEKIRHYIVYEGKVWEVDQFSGKNEGLIVAEIELETEDEEYSLPPWIGKNVTAEGKYTNASLAQFPFIDW